MCSKSFAFFFLIFIILILFSDSTNNADCSTFTHSKQKKRKESKPKIKKELENEIKENRGSTLYTVPNPPWPSFLHDEKLHVALAIWSKSNNVKSELLSLHQIFGASPLDPSLSSFWEISIPKGLKKMNYSLSFSLRQCNKE